MFEKLKSRWKVNGINLALIITTFALGGSLCGFAGRRLLLFTGLEKGATWLVLATVHDACLGERANSGLVEQLLPAPPAKGVGKRHHSATCKGGGEAPSVSHLQRGWEAPSAL